MGYQTHKAAIAALARMAATGQPTRGGARSSLLRLGLCLGAILLLGFAITLPPQIVSAGVANLSKAGSALDSASPLLTPVKSKGKGKHAGKRVYPKKGYSAKRYKRVHPRGRVVVRPVRHWHHRPYYGNVFAGVALGTLLGVAAVGIAPIAPSPDLCWYWSDPYMNRGYWDYCY